MDPGARMLPDKTYFRVDEVAAHFGVSPRSVYRWIRRGRLAAVRISGAVRIPGAALTTRLDD